MTTYSKINGTYSIEWVPVNELTVDIAVQQPLREGKVRDMLRRGFDPAAAGVIEVSRRADGSKVVLDGQTRREVARRSGVEEVECKVWEGLSLADEAWLFTYLNKKSNPTAVSTFKTRIVAGEDVPCGIRDILARNGWQVTDAKCSSGNFASVVTAERIYRGTGSFKSQMPGSQIFSQTVHAATAAWGTPKEASDKYIISGIAHMFIRHYREIDFDRLVRQLSRDTPARLRADMRAWRSTTGDSVEHSAYRVILKAYNAGLRATSRLGA